jgi:hypothetical protein
MIRGQSFLERRDHDGEEQSLKWIEAVPDNACRRLTLSGRIIRPEIRTVTRQRLCGTRTNESGGSRAVEVDNSKRKS